MRITKHGHACVSIEQDGRRVLIDPGSFTADIGSADSIDAVVITHEHVDHWSLELLGPVVAANPGVQVFTTAGVAGELGELGAELTVIDRDQQVEVGGFGLRFYVGMHALIHPTIPQPYNLGVMVDDAFYYSGDSFIEPDRSVETLALPVAAPWLKIGEVMDYLERLNPTSAFGTHDAILSDPGLGLVARLVGATAERVGSSYAPLRPGDTLDR